MTKFIMKDQFQNKTAIIILAAGNSSRLGRPKQLLEYKDSTLLKNTISEALKVPNSFTIVVTGANHNEVQKELNTTEINICFNPEWENGMSSSIVKGLNELLLLKPDCDECIFAVCDQPFVTNLVFENLISEYHKTKKGIIASAYSETLGTPVLFHRKYFNELLELSGQEGAKKIIKKYLEDTVSVPFVKGNIDIDTEEDYNKLISE
ncbi:nucleotidyltransferase family protein [Flavobacterium sp. WLB]|uniref:nucleotidyltransferase family protein n=1 Tax=unclassified Flavobacterium TaxID=196869 RepID=UPI0006AB862D|nr:MULTISPECIES: nucleotidyltransferase family protein [unclassified Flavobacterium]KOP38309.1 molybdopterin-guanine dinucleotide biosynthesis protein MobA [Flavobacterium sp. VMW]OWU92192.1 molybdopterin-guanine dinucleotide biosynthesis protein MobA [Flavobacterium sp. NLM]PUU71444.1 nucleotidyltransferase family protein [Flavobacterium sp. WLB]